MAILNITIPPVFAELKSTWACQCANEACGMTSFLRAMSRRKLGIRVAGNWYCSPKCFESAARKEFGRMLSAAAPVAKRPRPRMPIGLILYSRGELTSEQLNMALDMQKDSGMKMGEVLVNLGYATERQVTSALASQWGYPVFSLKNRVPFVPVRVPRVLMELYSMLPVHFVETGRRLVLGFVDGIDHSVMYVLERMTGCTAIPCFITAGEYQRNLANIPIDRQENEVIFDRINTNPMEMARISTSYATQIGADEARFATCSSYGWVRLTGQRQEVDLLFRLRTA